MRWEYVCRLGATSEIRNLYHGRQRGRQSEIEHYRKVFVLHIAERLKRRKRKLKGGLESWNPRI